MQTIAERLNSAYETVKQSTLAANRLPNSVQLLAVSKTKPVLDIEHAYAQGQRLFGENYVQEGVEKIQALAHLSDIQWHFIGPLQSNKTKLVAEYFDWVQSVDRFKIAQRLNDQRSPFKKLNICIQVNIDAEVNKNGLAAEDVVNFAHQLATLPQLQLRGLMAIPKATPDPIKTGDSFARMQRLYLQLQEHYPHIDTLSMGMSGDLDPAIQHGSTMVRLGTAIFGQRAKQEEQ